MRILTLPPQLQETTSPPARFPLRLTIPPDRAMLPGLALPNRQWRRLEDGSIEVVFNSSEELWVCIEATRVIRARTAE